MLSREERIFGELLLARGLVAQEFIDGFAKTHSSDESAPSLAEFLIDSGGIAKEQADEALEEARAIDGAMAPHLACGARLGEFRLIREIGRGGMGIVYEAEQESLDRRVALKVLPAGAALDERLAIRFLREARSVGRLQHPGIVPVFASGRAEGVLYFAMELVQGRPLSEIVAAGALAPARAARIAAEIARALQHAHEAALIHRDVKPDNILVDTDDRARLTDFGLVHESVESSFTLPRHVLGTPAYMAPEQALGSVVDPRSDIYAVGAVLYAMLSGKPPYSGDLPSQVLSRVLAGPPPSLPSLRGDIPPALLAICERAMARDPAARYQNAQELAEDLEAFGRGATPAAYLARSKSRKLGRPIGVAVLLAAGLSIMVLATRHRPQSPAVVASLPAPEFVLVNATPGEKHSPTLSPDGKLLAYAAFGSDSWSLWLEDLTTRETVRLSKADFSPKFSPDGRSLAVGNQTGLGVLNVSDRTTQQFSVPFMKSFSVAWSPDGREIVFGGDPAEGAAGGSVPRIWALDLASQRLRVVRSMDVKDLAYSPKGSRIAFVSRAGGSASVWTLPPQGGEAVRLTDDTSAAWSPLWSSDGKRVYFGSDRNGTPALWSVDVDENSWRPIHAPELVMPIAFAASFTASSSADGRRMAIVCGDEPSRLFGIPLDAGARSVSGMPVALRYHSTAATTPQPSPDGKLIVFSALSRDADLAIMTAQGSDPPRFLTNDEFDDRAPRWSPDGGRIAFNSNRSGKPELWTIRPDGSELRQLTTTISGDAGSPVWSPDGARLAYSVSGEGAGAFLIAATPGSEHARPEALPPTTDDQPFEPSSWSPDGMTLAGTSRGVVLYSIRDRTYRRVTDFGEKPVWLGDGRSLMFASDRAILVVDAGGGTPRRLYDAAPSTIASELGIAGDGRTIYAALGTSQEEIWIADFPH